MYSFFVQNLAAFESLFFFAVPVVQSSNYLLRIDVIFSGFLLGGEGIEIRTSLRRGVDKIRTF